ncbi:MAG: 3-dehydroquinate synthase [Bacteroidetes bacterium]|nr:3-dehydroquinate synthase [Bacteroidota bacterium]
MPSPQKSTDNNKIISLNGCDIHFPDEKHFGRIISGYIGETEKNFILTDINTAKLCLPLVRSQFPGFDESRVITIDSGEGEKNISSLHHIWSFLLHHGAGRDSCLLNLGGGMITDLGGFAASTYKRGIRFVHIPTSLMGMTDAAIGGKTGINIGGVKNQAGTFALPEAVIVMPGFLKTLPWNELLSGFAEIFKAALALDHNFWNEIKGLSLNETERTAIISRLENGIIRKSIEIKSEVVASDFRDQGKRQCLNFGHSIGHAMELLKQGATKDIPHGYAVAAGMLCEAFISKLLCGLSAKQFSDIEKCICVNFPKTKFEKKDNDGIISLIRHDKKNVNDRIMMSLLKAPGTCMPGVDCPEAVIREGLSYYFKKA